MDGDACGSFHVRPATAAGETSLDLRELVLDVPQGSAVLLRRKVSRKKYRQSIPSLEKRYVFL